MIGLSSIDGDSRSSRTSSAWCQAPSARFLGLMTCTPRPISSSSFSCTRRLVSIVHEIRFVDAKRFFGLRLLQFEPMS